ncbi:hypothetical protein KNP414_04319 [Paenibacillus mucilaginosus KNP414]|uniref:Uncharacterized protein n=1 Tax=Paenibacillus mucilaginosus (strain KNP414) TaxID=1036673 RepID=F8FJK1_PAEMK|nr:hypothetical protein KNP414_04319 [Paenibacillus mucilaginosus KNP414]
MDGVSSWKTKAAPSLVCVKFECYYEYNGEVHWGRRSV